MQKIKILTDTASDITILEAQKLNISLIPFKLIIGDKEYNEGYDISKKEFYKLVRECGDSLPTHSQITPFEYQDMFEKLNKEGYQHIIVVPINKKGSSTFQNAVSSRELFYESNPLATVKIHIINCLTYSGGYGHPVKVAAKMAMEEKTIEEILSYLEDWFSRYNVYCTVYDLKYAALSGRVGKAAAIAGGLLGIKPIITFTGGDAKTVTKARSFQKSLDILAEIVSSKISDDKVFNIFYGENEKDAFEFKKRVEKELNTKAVDTSEIGACITVNIGPEVIGIGFLGEKSEMKVIY